MGKRRRGRKTTGKDPKKTLPKKSGSPEGIGAWDAGFRAGVPDPFARA